MSVGSLTLVLVAGLMVLAVGIYLWTDRSSHAAAEPPEMVTVDRIIDGDTFVVSTAAGQDLGRVRVLGIDTPEMARDGQPALCHAEEATAAATELLQGQRMQISHDPTQDRRDIYGRPLVYIDVDGRDFGEAMLKQGLAKIYIGPTMARQQKYHLLLG